MVKFPKYSVKNVGVLSALVVVGMHVGLNVIAKRPEFQTPDGKRRIAKGRKLANSYAVLMTAEVAMIAYIG